MYLRLKSKFYKLFVLLFFIVFVVTNSSMANKSSQSSDKQRQHFIAIKQIDPTIIIDLKYATNDNLLGRVIDGYSKPEALLTVEAAKALRAVQEYLAMRGFCLVVYDAYHPVRSYKAIEEWASYDGEKNNEDIKTKEFYYPNIDKRALIANGYIRNKLDHTRGSTVDVTIIPLKKKLKKSYSVIKISYKDNRNLIYKDDGTLDMGSSYDTFDPTSMHANYEDDRSVNNTNNTNYGDLISKNAKKNRALLKEAMESNGFIANKQLWWQYSLAREPFPDTKFDFDM